MVQPRAVCGIESRDSGWRSAGEQIVAWVQEGARLVEGWAPIASGKTECASEVAAALASTGDPVVVVVRDDDEATHMSDLLSARFVQDVTVWDVGDYLEGLERCTKWPYVATVIDLGSVQAPVPASGNLIRFTDPYRQQAPLGGDVIHWRSSRLVPSIARAIDIGRYGGSGWCLPQDATGVAPDHRVAVSRVGHARECAVVARHYAASTRDDFGLETAYATVRDTPVGDIIAVRPEVLVLAYMDSDPDLLARFMVAAGAGVRIVTPEHLDDPLLKASESGGRATL